MPACFVFAGQIYGSLCMSCGPGWTRRVDSNSQAVYLSAGIVFACGLAGVALAGSCRLEPPMSGACVMLPLNGFGGASWPVQSSCGLTELAQTFLSPCGEHMHACAGLFPHLSLATASSEDWRPKYVEMHASSSLLHSLNRCLMEQGVFTRVQRGSIYSRETKKSAVCASVCFFLMKFAAVVVHIFTSKLYRSASSHWVARVVLV